MQPSIICSASVLQQNNNDHTIMIMFESADRELNKTDYYIANT